MNFQYNKKNKRQGEITLKLSVLENLLVCLAILLDRLLDLNRIDFDTIQVMLELVIPLETHAFFYVFSWNIFYRHCEKKKK